MLSLPELLIVVFLVWTSFRFLSVFPSDFSLPLFLLGSFYFFLREVATCLDVLFGRFLLLACLVRYVRFPRFPCVKRVFFLRKEPANWLPLCFLGRCLFLQKVLTCLDVLVGRRCSLFWSGF